MTRDVRAGQLTAEDAAACRTTLEAALALLSERALELLHRNTAGFRWYATVAAADRADRELTRAQEEGVWRAFYDTTDGTIHLSAQSEMETHLHEIAHAVDGPSFALTKAAAWQAAYNAERGRHSGEAYPASSPQEWWAALAVTSLVRADDWQLIRRRMPRSARLLEGVFHARTE